MAAILYTFRIVLNQLPKRGTAFRNQSTFSARGRGDRGHAGDVVHRFALCLEATAALLSLLLWSNILIALLALTLMGIGYGSVAGAYPVITSRPYGTANVSRAYGRICTAWGATGLTDPYVGELPFDRSGGYGLSIACAAGAALLASLVCLGLRSSRANAERST